jgi:hypothetical protein
VIDSAGWHISTNLTSPLFMIEEQYTLRRPKQEGEYDVSAVTMETEQGQTFRFSDRDRDAEWARGNHVFIFNKMEIIDND